MKLEENRPIPRGWAWDSKGKVTTDPKAASEGGSIIPIGGHKGSCLAAAVDLFTGVLSGFQFGAQVGGLFTSETEAEGVSCLMLAFNVIKMLGPEALDRAEELMRWYKESPLADGFEGIVMPGEPEERVRKKRLKEGIPLSERDVRLLNEVAEGRGVESPL